MSVLQSVNVLIEMLQGINEGTVPFDTEQYDGDDTVYVACEAVEDLVYELLITAGGGCNWDNIRMLERAGFSVYAGEKDSFGWLTGCIDTNKGVIVYG